MNSADQFAEVVNRLLERAGEFMMEDEHGDFNETEVTRVCKMGNYINVDLDNGKRFKIVVQQV